MESNFEHEVTRFVASVGETLESHKAALARLNEKQITASEARMISRSILPWRGIQAGFRVNSARADRAGSA